MREKILFNKDWLFHRGDIELQIPQTKGPMYEQAKTERFRFGPASRFYRARTDDYGEVGFEINPTSWEHVRLPHDYVIEQIPDKSLNNALGYMKYENAWYRKTFFIHMADKGKRLTLYFEGIATHATIYLNGCLLKRNFCGYTSFEVDITDFVEFNELNVLAVYVDTQNHEGWWYEGGGIYRNVWLIKTEKVAVDLWGIYVKNQLLEDDTWAISVEHTIRNDSYDVACVQIKTEIFNGTQSVLALECCGKIPVVSKRIFEVKGSIQMPHLWDLDDPHQYLAVTKVYQNDVEVDSVETRFGFRDYIIDKEKGLFLNGKHVDIKGVCAHQDFGLTGKAVADNIQKYKVQLIKEMGANGYRCSHYPHSEATMDALDETGFIVMAETRWFDSSEQGLEQLEMLIRRDRNRPSVFFWSIGNEEPKATTEVGRNICKKMMSKIRSLDNQRLIVSAVSNMPDKTTVYAELDAIGINYNLDKYIAIHEIYPEKPIFASECCATGTTRGWYYDDDYARGYLNAFDKDTNSWFLGRERTWKFLSEHKWILGGYQWNAFEHRGECQWPRLCSQAGAIDLFMQKKDAFYQNQSLWIDDKPMIHLFPHWNFKGMEGQCIRVGAYTNCEAAELFLNEKSLGKQYLGKYDHAEWHVPYEEGKLRVLGYQEGQVVVEDVRRTTQEPVALRLKAENTVSVANGQDVLLITCSCVDKLGEEVPTAQPFVSFCVNSLGIIKGTGSDICDHTAVTLPQRKMRAGKITIAVQVGEQSGVLKIYAEAEGLLSAVFETTLNER